MKKTIYTFFLLCIMFLFGSCVSTHVSLPEYSIHEILPRESFVKVKIKIEVSKCLDEKNCFTQKLLGHGSGAVIKNLRSGSYILTAGHVCEEKSLEEEMIGAGFKFDLSMEIVDIDELRYDAKVVKVDSELDTCILFVKGMAKPEIKLRNQNLVIGKKYYNIAAPAAIFSENMIPILEGRYAGVWKEHNIAVYSIPAVGGSSGSPVVNKKGELVGMIHSVHVHFSNISFSPKTSDLYSFIESAIQ
jgi:S1-C subfamily serine protease